MDTELRENERIDDLERNGYCIIQNKSRFCFGMDAVLLSGFTCENQQRAGVRNLMAADLGTGTGIIPLLLHGRMCPDNTLQEGKPECERKPWIFGIEIQQDMAQMASRSVLLNRLEKEIEIICADLKEASKILGKSCFDIVTSNPPYMRSGKGLANPDDSKAISRHEVMCTFDDVAREAGALLKEGGRFCLVHRPERLAELIKTLGKYRLEPKRIRFVHSFADSEATMVLIESRKGAGQFMKVEKPLVIYKEKGVYTDEIINIYGY